MAGHVYLRELIAFLERQPQDAIIPFGFGSPHSYRGYYEQLAFEPRENARVGDMLSHAVSANGAWLEGYKGGLYQMTDYSECWIAEYGTSAGDKIGPTILALWEHIIANKQQ